MGNGISRSNPIFRDTPWLGFAHDGSPATPLNGYIQIRGLSDGSELSDTQLSMPTIARERAALYQSLLTFGLLEAVLETSVPERALLRDGMVSSDAIASLLLECVLRVQLASDSDAAAWLRRAQKSLLWAQQILWMCMQPGKNLFARAGLDEAGVAANMCMAAAIGEALTGLTTHFPPMLERVGLDWSFVLAAQGRAGYREEMVGRGWCPSLAEMLGASVATMQYVAGMEPVTDDNDHEKCTQGACVAYSVDTETYSPKHSMQDCTCTYLRPSHQDISESLSKGLVPVVLLKGTSDGKEELIVKSAADTEYIAISHVWVDGLGSTTEQGLPQCQLRRIAQLVQEILPDGGGNRAFWIDGLCVPKRQDTRKRAIGLMAHTYANAKAVLVIDSGIRTCSVDDVTRTKLLRVHTSMWMRRLWTFQEAVLARRLVFWFADGLVEFEDLIPSLNDSLDVVSVHLASQLMRLGKKNREILDFTIGDAMRGISWRTTSKAEDETLAVAGLLNVDALKLTDLPPEERMLYLLSQVRKLPRNVLLLSGPKSQQPGFQWAPRTFMTNVKSELGLATLGNDAMCTEDGLVAKYSAFFFDQVTIRPGQAWFVHDTFEDRMLGIVDLEEGQGSSADSIHCDGLLFIDPIFSEKAVICVAVLAHPLEKRKPSATDEDVWRCSYKRRLAITSAHAISKSGEPLTNASVVVEGKFRVGMICVS